MTVDSYFRKNIMCPPSLLLSVIYCPQKEKYFLALFCDKIPTKRALLKIQLGVHWTTSFSLFQKHVPTVAYKTVFLKIWRMFPRKICHDILSSEKKWHGDHGHQII